MTTWLDRMMAARIPLHSLFSLSKMSGHLHLSVSILDVSGCATPGYDVELTRVIPIVEKHVDYAMLAEHNPRR